MLSSRLSYQIVTNRFHLFGHSQIRFFSRNDKQERIHHRINGRQTRGTQKFVWIISPKFRSARRARRGGGIKQPLVLRTPRFYLPKHVQPINPPLSHHRLRRQMHTYRRRRQARRVAKHTSHTLSHKHLVQALGVFRLVQRHHLLSHHGERRMQQGKPRTIGH